MILENLIGLFIVILIIGLCLLPTFWLFYTFYKKYTRTQTDQVKELNTLKERVKMLEKK